MDNDKQRFLNYVEDKLKHEQILANMVVSNWTDSAPGNNQETKLDLQQGQSQSTLPTTADISLGDTPGRIPMALFKPTTSTTSQHTQHSVTSDPISSKSSTSESALDADDSLTYPDGNITFLCPKAEDQSGKKVLPTFGWKLMTTNLKKLKSGFTRNCKLCLGVFCCPECSFTLAPLIPHKKQLGTQPTPKMPKGSCPLHPDLELLHQQCTCKMILTEQEDNWEVSHNGHHNHPRPPWSGRVDQGSLHALRQIIEIAPELTPLQLKTGTSTRKPARNIHPSFNNLDKLRYERRKITKASTIKAGKSSLIALINFATQDTSNIIQKSDFLGTHPHLIFQDQDMIDLLRGQAGPFETDSIEGFVHEPSLHGREINLTITSAFDMTMQRWAPVCISILFGKAQNDYRIHFNHLLGCIEGDNWTEFERNFIGNTSDMSDAIRLAFFAEMKSLASSKHGKILTDEDIVQKFKFCSVHFKRSKIRVTMNHSVVLPEKRKDFDERVNCLLTESDFNDFKKQCHSMIKHFPKCQNWLKWHLVPSRAVILFQACMGSFTDVQKWNRALLREDTNAQESMNKTFKNSASRSKLSFQETVEHVARFLNTFRHDRIGIKSGHGTQYGFYHNPGLGNRRQRKRKYVNDGRPPDVLDKLIVKGSNNKDGDGSPSTQEVASE